MLDDFNIVRPGKPSLKERIKTNLCEKLSKKQRKQLNLEYLNNVSNKDFSIFASFCGGGTLYHDIGMKFLSPTINLAFDGPDFLSFVENLEENLRKEIIEYKTDKVTYPVGRIDDIEIRFVHYENFDSAVQKWKERCLRVNFDKILIMATDRDGMNSPECLERFDKIPYHKVMFTSHKYHYPWAVYCPDFKNQQCVGVMTGIADLKGRRYYEKYINILQLLNEL